MLQIFVSYSSVDRPFCAQLAARLRRIYDYESVWYDEGLHGGEIWWNEILTHVAAADIVIFLMSRESLESPYCKAELAEAQRLGKQILPVLIRSKTQVPPDLRHIQYVDMSSGIDADNITELQASIRRMEKKIPDVPPPPLSPEPVDEPEIPEAERGKSAPRSSRGVIVFGAVAVIAVIAAVLLILSNRGDDTSGAALTETQVALAEFTQSASIPSVTDTLTEQEPLAATDTPTNISPPTDTELSPPTLSFTPITIPTFSGNNDLGIWENLAAIGVTANDQWSPFIREIDGFSMALVPAGCFMMGTGAEGETIDESPAHQQCFDVPFWIDVTEVTNAQYGSAGTFSGANRPRESVTWQEAQAFCLSRDGRLPTEREWEYAARGPDALEYPWGDTFDENNLTYEINGEPINVGSFPGGISWVGTLDMSGNVWEWTSSLYRDYEYDPLDGREDSTNDIDTVRVIRGGSSRNNLESSVRGAYRFFADAAVGLDDLGFRCVKAYAPSN